jgi:glycyl-tRNA synthetase beta chain
MPQLLLEFFSEEIPARMQKRAEEDLARALAEKLKGAGLEAKAIKAFSSPRRLGAVIEDLPSKAADVKEEKKGPRVGAPDAAIQGFLNSAGLKDIGDAQIVQDKKGDFYVARIERAGRETSAILAEIIPKIVRGFPWPKSMRSGTSDLQWVRPLQNILCLFGGAHVPISIDGVASDAQTWGHRFHAPGAIQPKDFADYAAKLRAAKVLIDREERKAIILAEAQAACAKRGLELVADLGLLEEVAGLVEWPLVLLGDMSADFLDLPHEVIRLSMRTHQKYFAVRDPKTQKLAPHFVVVANVEARDGGRAIAAGNARVLSARLNDARFFWDADRKTPLYTEERKAKLQKIVFHQKLGSVWDKVERVKALAVELCAVTGADVELVKRAALLCKMDLVTETVGEFPELQGQIGRQLYLAEQSARLPLDGGGVAAGDGGGARAAAKSDASRGKAGKASGPHPLSHAARDSSPIEGEQIALAIEDHYRPLGPNDRVPSDPVAITLALADKLDTLVGFWAIDEKPTGSSDPYALRRAALGVVRVIQDNGIRFGSSKQRQRLLDYVDSSSVEYFHQSPEYRALQEDSYEQQELEERVRNDPKLILLRDHRPNDYASLPKRIRDILSQPIGSAPRPPTSRDLLAFLADRLKVQLREQGKRHDLVDAVFALGDDDLVRIVARVEALDAFLKTEAGVNLLAASKRAANILAAEEKKGKWSAEEAQGAVDASKLAEPAEKALHTALESAIPLARFSVEKEDFAAAMRALAGLRAPVDGFFEGVLVNAEDASLRRNRLLLLSRLREALSAVADFSKVEG